VVENPGLRPATVKPVNGKEFVFQTYLIRNILDHARDVEEAVDLADKYLPFDIEANSVSAHLFIVDATGKSVVLEYGEYGWEAAYSDKPWQVLTNTPVYNVPDQTLREQCWRYKSLATALDEAKGEVAWKPGLKMLQAVSQKGTTWSVVYSLPTRELHVCVYQTWETTYHMKPF
jgi:penicillin V acylase-like amidase (Ntn superfamily)